MKRRSFLASLVAGVIAPFLPGGEVEARDVFVPDTTGQSDWELKADSDDDIVQLQQVLWRCECYPPPVSMYIPDPERAGEFLVFSSPPPSWFSCID